MPRAIRAWEYLFGGLSFAGAGLALMLGSTLVYSMQVPHPGVALLLVEIGFGVLVFGIGGFWLWKFDTVRRQESRILLEERPTH